eukprot:TRINITY_DN67468_c0_g1_i1.p2 TRINITY_DN67468_c0_g1~~TRINITY_DN67468_c0_g1_i1.p2  ORF type:complete len:466 (+),score=256.60 TRINITY_DN67468_c0_g1_i1:59-1456(+)
MSSSSEEQKQAEQAKLDAARHRKFGVETENLSAEFLSIPFDHDQFHAELSEEDRAKKHAVTATEKQNKLDQLVLDDYEKYLVEQTQNHFGYPYNLSYDHEELFSFLRFSINNLGDPFVESNYRVHSRPFELAVLDFFARLWKIDVDDYWGYCTCSGTEGNLHGILLAREVLPDAILFASKESHYSVFKAARFYRMQAVPVDTTFSGEIDYHDLESKLSAHLDKPVIINVNCGTTVKGAVDDLDRILRLLNDLEIPEERFYIHVDGALQATMLPFIKHGHEVSFKKPIGSIAVSGHKFLGCPLPCGVVITRKRHIQKLEQSIEYLNSKDTTIMGSRNGQAPLFLWYTLRKKGCKGLSIIVQNCLRNARYLRDLLRKNKVSCMLNSMSSTVVFERPDEAFVKKWQLACVGNIAHVVVMPNVTPAKIDLFMKELVEARNKNRKEDICVHKHIGHFCVCNKCSDTKKPK